MVGRAGSGVNDRARRLGARARAEPATCAHRRTGLHHQRLSVHAARQDMLRLPSLEEAMMKTTDKLAALRERMKRHKLAAYLVPSTDAHQSEYVPECWQRRAWLSGFSGSAGDVVVTRDDAGLWTDGRYFLQAAEQLRGRETKIRLNVFGGTL